MEHNYIFFCTSNLFEHLEIQAISPKVLKFYAKNSMALHDSAHDFDSLDFKTTIDKFKFK